jgi:hypothetical protein
MVALWLPATLHCQLEELPGLQFLTCCDHETEAPHQDDDCQTDFCAMVEGGLYKTNGSKVTAAPMAARLIDDFALAASTDAQAPGRRGLPATANLAELSVTWQFSYRAALPPRAPSFDS